MTTEAANRHRPRDPLVSIAAERLATYGPTGVSDSEILALGVGLRKLDLAIEALRRMPLHDLVRAPAVELAARLGLTRKQSMRLAACLELARRAVAAPTSGGATIHVARDVAQLMASRLTNLDHEEFWCLALDSKHRVKTIYCVSQGSLSATLVHPREAFREAVRVGAASVIFAHNHPSNSVDPSPEDIALTCRLRDCGTLLGVRVLDHVVIGNEGKFSSIQEDDKWKSAP